MNKLNVAVLGAGGIGKYHVREFSNLDSNVVAILGSSRESSYRTSEKLKEDFGFTVKPHYVLEELLEKEELDSVSICTPPEMHEDQIRSCLKRGLHVMCEKPLIQTGKNNYIVAKDLFELSKTEGKILTVNTQWASMINYFGKHANLDDLKKLSIKMEPEERGIGMLRDHLPHTNSVLLKLVPNGKSRNIEFSLEGDGTITTTFEYKNSEKTCKVEYIFSPRTKNPGEVVFSLNDNKFRREIGQGYTQSFVTSQDRFEIKDPLQVSVGKFLEACNGFGPLLVEGEEILENIFLTEQIIKKCVS